METPTTSDFTDLMAAVTLAKSKYDAATLALAVAIIDKMRDAKYFPALDNGRDYPEEPLNPENVLAKALFEAQIAGLTPAILNGDAAEIAAFITRARINVSRTEQFIFELPPPADDDDD